MKTKEIAERVAGFLHRRSTEVNPVAFNEISRGLQSCLICMPGRLDMIKPAAEILPDLAKAFPNRNLKILLTCSIDPQSHDIIKRFVVLRTEQKDMDRFSMPKREFVSRISSGGVGIAIDMDTKPNFFNAVVALKSGARVRTTFDKGVGLPYYNFLVGINEEDKSPRAWYRAMADILVNFGV